ncbi:sensor histidine kinase [Clostridium oryzae]|uniref:histidine kinase n=1 Tax=Clostridium oryzae TaxID=1450648 RepID=A0A1V4J0F9_9CLOT|nr:HAMP domain-containing sensor histidine kinase [Clostridium oryzae]OPJ65137.1 alkaline phosphatase synthesis sensor protein PhoR [Clostridium oryzae]
MTVKDEYLISFMAALIIVLAAAIIFVIIYHRKRYKKLANSIEEMIAAAIDGSFEQKKFDETKLSSIENSMWRFLNDSSLSSSNLADQKKKIQTLISDISHQTVTPIANITLYSELLEEQALQLGSSYEDGMKEEITAIREQADKLDFLIQSLVKLSRLENGIITVNAKKDNIQKVLSAVDNQMKAKAKHKQIELMVTKTQEQAVFDAKWTEEAIMNIVDNAIKYTPVCGKVSISVEPYQIFLRIDIKDNGIGIAEEEQGRIFTRFYRSTEVSDKAGVGVGLYLAREVINAQNGYIKVKSKIGEGSTFSVFLLR